MEIPKIVVVTGSSGMVGSALKKIVYIRQANDLMFANQYRWVWLTRKDVDLESYTKVYAHFENYDSEKTIVINLAANVGGLFKNMDNNLSMFESNIRINLNLLESCRKLKIPKVINILSTCIFPDEVDYPLTEEQINNGVPHNSNPGYSYSKRTGQIYTKLINASTQGYFKYVNLIPTNLYGNRDNYNVQDAHVIPAIIHKCVSIIKSRGELSNTDSSNSDKLILPGDGQAERMFLYDEDFARVILDLACFKDTSGDYIVSGNIENSLTIEDLADIISNKIYLITNHTIKIDFENDSFGNGQNKKPCSNAKLVNLYSEWGDIVPIDDSLLGRNLESVISWFWHNYDEYARK